MDWLASYYDGYDEDARLVKDNCHRIEFLTTIHYLEQALAPGSAILDVAAGTGPYAFYLAAHGHTVTARDVVPRHVEAMRAKAGTPAAVDIAWGDARDLSTLAPASFDAVLCMGPVYHLQREEERQTVVHECVRVLKPGGVLVLAYISRHAQHLIEVARGLRAPGQRGDDTGPFYPSTPREVASLVARAGLQQVAHLAADGIGYLLADRINGLDAEGFQAWMAYHLQTCEDPSLIGCSLHNLFIGRR